MTYDSGPCGRIVIGEQQHVTPPDELTGSPVLEPTQAPADPTGSATPPTPAPEAPETDPDAPLSLDEEEPPAPTVDLGQARSFLTELRPSGFGELLVTDVWLPPAPLPKRPPRKKKDQDGAPEPVEEAPEPPDRQTLWERRHELRELNLLRERPAASFDARTEHYWGHVKEALAKAPAAITDPYTELVVEFADIDHDRLEDRRREVREYGRQAEARVALGRAYLAIGRLRSARDMFRAAAKADPYYADACWHLGMASLFARAYPEASAALARAVDQNPGDLRMETAFGVALFHERKYEEAEEHLRRTAGARLTCRSLLCCTLRAQGKWDEARAELNLLRYSGSKHWQAVADQCRDCVERGEQKQAGALRVRRRRVEIAKSLATAAAGVGWVGYSLAEKLFSSDMRIALVPLFILVLLFGRSLKHISGKEQSTEFGNHEQGLPCWQTTTWVRPRRAEF